MILSPALVVGIEQMSNAVVVKRGATRVLVTVGAGTVLIISLSLVVSMLIFPDVWSVGITWLLRGVTFVVIAAGGAVVAGAVMMWRERSEQLRHTVEMNYIEERRASILTIPHTAGWFDAVSETFTPAYPLLAPVTEPVKTTSEVVVNATVTDRTDGYTIKRLGVTIEGIESEHLRQLARRVMAGESFTERTAARCEITQKPFYELRDVMLKNGYAEWKNPRYTNQGIKLTPAGVALMADIADGDPLP